MASGKEILTKIRSVENTQKITRAMQMVATSKMRKTQERMYKARPYADKVKTVTEHLAAANETGALPLLQKHKSIQRACFVLITTDKGLCGGLNANILKRFFTDVRHYQEKNIPVDVVCFGSKGLAACQRVGLNVISSAIGLGDKPKLERLLGSLKVVFDRYEREEIDVVHLVYSRFINTMRQEPCDEYFLPMGNREKEKSSKALEGQTFKGYRYDYEFEPDATEVLAFLVKRYLESIVYQAVCDNMASEQAARMVAMKAATDNASNAIKFLRLKYNKSRQAAITTELSEIVAGAEAV